MKSFILSMTALVGIALVAAGCSSPTEPSVPESKETPALPDPKSAAPGPSGPTGSITGRVHLTGTAPGNTVIRMGVDPICANLTKGKQVIQAQVVANKEGDLANAFVMLKGSFPGAPAPTKPVSLDQKDCLFAPRVMGAQVGQTLEVRNSDEAKHNTHSQSNHDNFFNLMQASSDVVSSYQFKNPETMLKVTCDLHRWMVAYIGVVDHPYFAVTAETGTFKIEGVPVGKHTIEVWHERFGLLTQTVEVAEGSAAVVDFAYIGEEKPPRGAKADAFRVLELAAIPRR